MQDNSTKPQLSAITYKVIKVLGEGSYGKAYLVTRNIDHMILVLKAIKIENMIEKEQREAEQEAKFLEKMDHSNIIKIHEFFVKNTPYKVLNIVMEYADGGDLGQKIKSQPKSRPFPEHEIIDYFTQICLALKHIHSKQIIHRDLKSQNVFLTKSGLVKLGDFGIAKSLNCTLEKAMTMIGTPYYLSPEIVTGKPYSYKSDIWSLGVLLYEMMALKMPFDANSLPILSLKIMKGNYDPLPYFYSKDLRLLVMSMLHVDENKRPSASDILKLPIIKSRILTFLNEVEYDKEFTKTMVTSYKNQIKNKKNIPSHNINIRNSHKSTKINPKYNDKEKDSKNPSNNVMINNQKKNDVKNEKNLASKQNEPHPQQQQQQIHQHIQPQPNQNLEVKHHFNNQQQLSLIQKIKMKEESVKESSQHNQDSSNNSNKNKIKKQKTQEVTNNNNESKPKANYPTPAIKVITTSNDLKNFILKSRQEMKKKMVNEEVIWPKKNPVSASFSNEEKQPPFPKIIILEKQSSNPLSPNHDDAELQKEEEDEYNANRLLNELNSVIEDKKEDSDNEDSEINTGDILKKKSSSSPKEDNQIEEGEIQLETDINMNSALTGSNSSKEQSSIQDSKKKEISSEYIADYSKIEEMKMELERALGVELFKTIYHCVDSCSDPKIYLFDTDKIKEKLKKDLIERKYSQKEIDLSIDKITEVISIVLKDRTSNMSV